MDWLALQDEEKLPDLKTGDELAVIEVSMCLESCKKKLSTFYQIFSVPLWLQKSR